MIGIAFLNELVFLGLGAYAGYKLGSKKEKIIQKFKG